MFAGKSQFTNAMVKHCYIYTQQNMFAGKSQFTNAMVKHCYIYTQQNLDPFKFHHLKNN